MAHKATTIIKSKKEGENWICVKWERIAFCQTVTVIIEEFGFEQGKLFGEVRITAPERKDEFERNGIRLGNITMQEALDNLIKKIATIKGIELEAPVL